MRTLIQHFVGNGIGAHLGIPDEEFSRQGGVGNRSRFLPLTNHRNCVGEAEVRLLGVVPQGALRNAAPFPRAVVALDLRQLRQELERPSIEEVLLVHERPLQVVEVGQVASSAGQILEGFQRPAEHQRSGSGVLEVADDANEATLLLNQSVVPPLPIRVSVGVETKSRKELVCILKDIPLLKLFYFSLVFWVRTPKERFTHIA